MKVAAGVAVGIAIAVAAAVQVGKGPQMDKTKLIELVTQTAREELDLTPVACVEEVNQGRPGVSCYAAPYSAEEFARRVDTLKGFKNLTGWRDDYGVMGAGTQYRDVPRRVGFIYTRPNSFWSGEENQELRTLKAEGYVVLVITDDNPKDF